MHLLAVSLYEFGQFLRILLWVFIPMVIITSLITTYIHYRNKRQQHAPGGQSPFSDQYGDTQGQYHDTQNRLASIDTTGAYQGMLWIKEKYEQYREAADQKYERLKEELSRSEKRYIDLLASRSEIDVRPVLEEGSLGRMEPDGRSSHPVPGDEKQEPAIEYDSLRDLVEEKNCQINFLQSQLEQRIRNFHLIEYQRREDKNCLVELQEQYREAQQAIEDKRQLLRETQESLHEKEQQLGQSQQSLRETQQLLKESEQSLQLNKSTMELLNEELERETRKSMELTGKLESSSLLLLHIYEELDRSMKVETGLTGVEKAAIDLLQSAASAQTIGCLL
jgi:hypothetical protein